MAMRLSGVWFKLVEPDGFYLGILMVPKEVADGIESVGRYRTARRRPEDYIVYPKANAIRESISMIDFVPADHLMRDAIIVYGVSMSDLNKERGFAFIPSADYHQRGPSLPKMEPVKAQSVDSRFSVLDLT